MLTLNKQHLFVDRATNFIFFLCKKIKLQLTAFTSKTINTGVHNELNSYDKLRAITFNILNIAGIGITFLNLLYIIFFYSSSQLSTSYLLINIAPLFICVTIFIIMKLKKVNTAYMFAFVVFPILLLTMNFYLKDRAVYYFHLVFMVYSFFFFDSFKIILPIFAISLGCFTYGAYYEITEHINSTHAILKNYEIISFISAMLLFYITLHFVKIRVASFQVALHKQRKEVNKKNEELELQRSQLKEKNEILNKIFSIVSHDLRVPIEGMRLILRSCNDEKAMKDVVLNILPDFRKEITKMSSLFENLISWAKLEMNNDEFIATELDVNLVVNKVVNLLKYAATNKNIIVKKAIPHNLKCYGNSNVLEIVLRNLISNSIKFCNAGNTITIEAKNTTQELLLIVTDNGKGMNVATLANIQKKNFYTTVGTNKEYGTGLGLMICYEMIEKHKGSIDIKSEEGKGTSISIKIPFNNYKPQVPIANVNYYQFLQTA
jgi:two-component system, sensor histidine kinase and response regulator